MIAVQKWFEHSREHDRSIQVKGHVDGRLAECAEQVLVAREVTAEALIAQLPHCRRRAGRQSLTGYGTACDRFRFDAGPESVGFTGLGGSLDHLDAS